MTIHHSQIKKAEKLGFTLIEEGEGVKAFWPKRALPIYGASAADAMAQMQAAIAIASDDEFRISTQPGQRTVYVTRSDGNILDGCPMPPVAAHGLLFGGKAEWRAPVDPDAELPVTEDEEQPPKSLADAMLEAGAKPKEEIQRINGIAVDGGIAFKEGTPAGDCPYSSESEEEGDEEYDNFIRWNDEWDAAADEAQEEEDSKGGTVVAPKYRAKYAEAGHATHCGDWLAETLNDIVLNKEGTNIELFEAIANMNGVSLDKYKRDGIGWQGRLRMTGRNLMAKKVYQNEGKLILPETLGGFKQAPAEWMAQQRFKGKAAG